MQCDNEQNKALSSDVGEAEVEAAMRAFETMSSVLRYREAEKWHACDVMGMRLALAAAYAVRPASSPQDRGEALLSSAGLSRQDLFDALASSHEQQVAAERERDETRAVLRSVEWTGGAWISEGHGRFCPVCQGWDRDGHAPGCALAAALDPPPRGATGPSGTWDGRGEVADGGEGGGGAN